MKINKWLVMSCTLLLLMNCTHQKNMDIQGHRGCRGLLPENSLPAFEKALDLGVHTLELDLAISKDHKVVVSHEPFMSRTICQDPLGQDIPKSDDMRYNLYEMNYAEIRKFDCGSKVHPRFPEQVQVATYKPLLSEVFELAEAMNPNIRYNIEIKFKPKYEAQFTPDAKTFVRLVLEQVIQYKVFERTNLQSFDLRILEEIKQQAPQMAVALLVDEDESIEDKLNALSYAPEIISPYFKLLSEDNVAGFQAKDYKVIPWTVNTIGEMQQMLRFNVDGIITDYPNRLLRVLRDD